MPEPDPVNLCRHCGEVVAPKTGWTTKNHEGVWCSLLHFGLDNGWPPHRAGAVKGTLFTGKVAQTREE